MSDTETTDSVLADIDEAVGSEVPGPGTVEGEPEGEPDELEPEAEPETESEPDAPAIE